MTRSTDEAHGTISEAAIWQDVEFGAYAADLPLWERIAAEGDGAALELGAGAGRVSIHLARSGAPVVALEPDRELADELARRCAEAGAPVTPVVAPAAALPGAWPLDAPPGCAIAPLHVIQMVAPEERRSALAAIGSLLRPGARLAATLVDEGSLGVGGDDGESPVPDMREVGGWVYSSEPLWVQLGGREIKVRRLRERVSPEGEMERSVHDEVLQRLEPDAFEREAAGADLDPVERVPIASGPEEADSIAVILEARR
jgi:SAM-dependent methyltransferase